MKRCTRCGIDQPVEMFSRFHLAKDGLSPQCKACCKERNSAYYAANADRVLAERRQKYLENPDAFREANGRWKEANPERHRFLQRRSHLHVMYGLTPERYAAMAEAQGRCVRGLLCKPCNRLLGWFDNNRAAIWEYVSEEADDRAHA